MEKVFELVIDGEDGIFQDSISAKNKNDLLAILKKKYPEDIGADAIGYDEEDEEFAINW